MKLSKNNGYADAVYFQPHRDCEPRRVDFLHFKKAAKLPLQMKREFLIL